MGGCEAGTFSKEARGPGAASLLIGTERSAPPWPAPCLLSSASLFFLPSISPFYLHWPLSEAQAAEHPLAEGINILN